ncbi:MAG: transporter substrate-binding domain-containing protein [Carbonactinosporaceae bacterium]
MRWLKVAALSLAALLLVSACGGSPEGELPVQYATQRARTLPAEVEKISGRGRLVVGVPFDRPLLAHLSVVDLPFDEAPLAGLRPHRGVARPHRGVGQPHRVEGFAAEIARLIALRIFGEAGQQVRFVRTSVDESARSLESGKIDLFIGATVMADDQRDAPGLAGPYYLAGQDLLVARTTSKIAQLEDLSGDEVCVATTRDRRSLRRLNPATDVDLRGSYDACAEALAEGEYTAMSGDDMVLAGYASRTPKRYRLVNAPFTTVPYGVEVPDGRPQLRQLVVQTLALIERNGDWRRAYDHTIGAIDNTPPVMSGD